MDWGMSYSWQRTVIRSLVHGRHRNRYPYIKVTTAGHRLRLGWWHVPPLRHVRESKLGVPGGARYEGAGGTGMRGRLWCSYTEFQRWELSDDSEHGNDVVSYVVCLPYIYTLTHVLRVTDVYQMNTIIMQDAFTCSCNMVTQTVVNYNWITTIY